MTIVWNKSQVGSWCVSGIVIHTQKWSRLQLVGLCKYKESHISAIHPDQQTSENSPNSFSSVSDFPFLKLLSFIVALSKTLWVSVKDAE